MSILSASNLAKRFADNEIFRDISVDVPKGARIALVGPNGAGKTTLLNILVDHDTPTEGTIHRAKNARIGYLTQRPELLGDHTLYDEVMRAFTDLKEQERELQALEDQMAEGNADAIERYGKLQEAFEQAGGYTYTQRAKSVLIGLGFNVDTFDMPLAKLSGGQKTRTVLARLLLEEPDLLALDEPTNHLDVNTVEWLEGYLKDFPSAVVSISHDRYFIDTFAKTVWELDFGRLETYRANYTQYVQQRGERRERWLKEFEAQQAFIAKEEDYIKRNIAGQNTRQAQGRRKRLERLKRDNLINRPDAERDKMNIALEITHRGNEFVLTTDNLTVGYPNKPILQVDNIKLERGEIAALIGPNGVGKSTFIKTVTRQIEPYAGEVGVGDKVEIGYFAQAHERLDPNKTVIDEIIETKRMTPGEARDYLARYLFRGDEVFRKIGMLSGGERGRVALAKLALGTANLLLLDEPTNHLDIPSQEVLEVMLNDYLGTVLLVSHDRYLIDALATQVWAASPPTNNNGAGTVYVHKGSYTEYIQVRNAQRLAQQEQESQARRATQTSANGAKTSTKKHGLNPYELKKRIEHLESEIERMEMALNDLTTQIEAASEAGNAAEVEKLGHMYTQTETALEAAVEEWGLLAED